MKGLVIALVGATALLIAPRPATACYCDGSSLGVLLPSDGAVDVPLNTRIWSSMPVRLYRGETRIPLRRNNLWTIRGDQLAVLTPEVPLEPRTRYDLKVERGAAWTLETWFETGDSIDEDAPAIPTVPEPELRVAPGLCGATTARWTIAHEGLLVTTSGDLAYAPRPGEGVGGHRGLDAEIPSGIITWATDAKEMRLGLGACIDNWRGAAPGLTEVFRFGIYDLAGNFSGWSEQNLVTFPPDPRDVDDEGDATEGDEPSDEEQPPADPSDYDPPPPTCSTATGGASLLALLLPLAALRRRR